MKKITTSLLLLLQLVYATAQTVNYTASSAIIANPERGLQKYSITGSNYATVAGANNLSVATLNGWKNSSDKVTVVFRYFLMDAFLNTDINAIYLDNIQTDFDHIRAAGVKAIVRFSYSNAQGSGPQQPSKAQILTHIAQLTPILQANKDVIFAHQAGFIGTWGEWYYTNSTEFGNEGVISPAQWANRQEVVDAMLAATPIEIPLQVRYVGIKTTLYGNTQLTPATAYQNSPGARIGFFNDAFLNNWGDQGTYGTGECVNPVGTTQYNFLSNETLYLPMSGETNGLNPCNGGFRTTGANAIYEMGLTNWTTLNRDYHPDFWNQISTADYQTILRNLGYRFVLNASTVTVNASGFNLAVNITNEGFARPFKQRNVYLVMKNTATNAVTTYLVNTDIRTWETTVAINQQFNPGLTGTFNLYLWMPDAETGLANLPDYAIQLANTGTWESATGYNNLLQTVTLSTPLPVELLSFEGRVAASAVVLNWTTVSESNNRRFEVERSADLNDWATIGTVDGAGSVGQEQDYQFMDSKPLVGLQFYRLKQVDYNGDMSVSKVVSVSFGGRHTELLDVYPNPGSGQITITLPDVAQKEGLDLLVFNVNGQVVGSRVLLPVAAQTIDVAEWPSGMYLFYVRGNGLVLSGLFVKP